MTDIQPIATVVLLVFIVAILLLLLRKASQSDTSVLTPRLDAFEKAQERTERAVREEVAISRDEFGKAAKTVRLKREKLLSTLSSRNEFIEPR